MRKLKTFTRSEDPSNKLNDIVRRLELLTNIKGKGGTKVQVLPTGVSIQSHPTVSEAVALGGEVKWVKLTADNWATATVYIAGNIRVNNSNFYTCILGHTSGALDDEPGVGAVWETYWETSDPMPAEDVEFDGATWIAGGSLNVYIYPQLNFTQYHNDDIVAVLKSGDYWFALYNTPVAFDEC